MLSMPPSPSNCPTQIRLQVVRLWVHECERVLSDRLVSEADIAKYREFRTAVLQKYFGDLPRVSVLEVWGGMGAVLLWGCAATGVAIQRCVGEAGLQWHRSLLIHRPPSPAPDAHPQAEVEAAPLLFNSFMARDANESPVYACAPSTEALKKALEEKLTEYNEGNAGGRSRAGLGLGEWG